METVLDTGSCLAVRQESTEGEEKEHAWVVVGRQNHSFLEESYDQKTLKTKQKSMQAGLNQDKWALRTLETLQVTTSLCIS